MSVTKIEGSRQIKFAGSLPLNGYKITGLADPVSAQDAATKNYVDNMSVGLDVKKSCRVASTAQISTKSGLLTIDGITLVASDRVLIKDDSDPRYNGVYVAATGAWTRASDFAAGMHVGGSFLFVEYGTVNGDNGFVCTSNVGDNDLIDDVASDIEFAQFSGAGQIIAGTGIAKSGNTISLAPVGSSGTYTKVTTDAYGRVTAGTSLAATDLPSGIDALKIGGGVVDNTEFSYLNGVTSAIQTQLNAKEASFSKGDISETISNVLIISNGTSRLFGSSDLLIQIKASSTSVSGYLSSTDWNTFNNKQAAITGGATSITSANLTASKALVSDASGKVATATTSAAEIGFVAGVTSAIQTQLNAKEATLTKGNLTEATSSVLTITGGTGAVIGAGLTIQVKQASTTVSGFLSTTDWNTFNNKQAAITGAATTITSANLALGKALVSDGAGKVAVSNVTATELAYVSGVTSAIQTQLNTKLGAANYIVRETPSGSLNGSNVSFILASAPLSGKEMVFLNGILQNAGGGNDYTITGNTITMLTAPLSTDVLLVTYLPTTYAN